jgi:two-component system response regulator
MIFLDLNLPKKDGRDVLIEIKNDENLKSIPVVVLTTSELDTDIERSYKSGANCYVTKPVTFEGLVDCLKEIERFWFSVAKLPVG